MYHRSYPRNPGLVHNVHREGHVAIPPPPRNWVDAASRWGANQAMSTGDHHGQTDIGSLGRRPFLLGPLSSPVLYPTAL